MARKERIRTTERNGESELEKKLPIPGSLDNSIKTDIVVVVSYYYLFL